jgi:hypothetical protein
MKVDTQLVEEKLIDWAEKYTTGLSISSYNTLRKLVVHLVASQPMQANEEVKECEYKDWEFKSGLTCTPPIPEKLEEIETCRMFGNNDIRKINEIINYLTFITKKR